MTTTQPFGKLDRKLRGLDAGCVRCEFQCRVDGELFRLTGDTGYCAASIEDGRLLYRVETPSRSALLDAEDTAPLTDGRWHSLAVVSTTVGPGCSWTGTRFSPGPSMSSAPGSDRACNCSPEPSRCWSCAASSSAQPSPVLGS